MERALCIFFMQKLYFNSLFFTKIYVSTITILQFVSMLLKFPWETKEVGSRITTIVWWAHLAWVAHCVAIYLVCCLMKRRWTVSQKWDIPCVRAWNRSKGPCSGLSAKLWDGRRRSFHTKTTNGWQVCDKILTLRLHLNGYIIRWRKLCKIWHKDIYEQVDLFLPRYMVKYLRLLESGL